MPRILIARAPCTGSSRAPTSRVSQDLRAEDVDGRTKSRLDRPHRCRGRHRDSAGQGAVGGRRDGWPKARRPWAAAAGTDLSARHGLDAFAGGANVGAVTETHAVAEQMAGRAAGIVERRFHRPQRKNALRAGRSAAPLMAAARVAAGVTSLTCQLPTSANLPQPPRSSSHDAHDVWPSSGVRLPVHPALRSGTCRSCVDVARAAPRAFRLGVRIASPGAPKGRLPRLSQYYATEELRCDKPRLSIRLRQRRRPSPPCRGRAPAADVMFCDRDHLSPTWRPAGSFPGGFRAPPSERARVGTTGPASESLHRSKPSGLSA